MERTIQEVRDILKELDDKYGFDSSSAKVLHNKKLTKALGRCTYGRNGVEKFDFSTLALNLEYEAFKEIIMHEWAHGYNRFVKGGRGHDESFKAVCRMIGCTNNGTKCNHIEELQVAQQKMGSAYKYMVSCESCGKQTRFERKPKVYKVLMGEIHYLGKYHCAFCKSENLKATKLQ